MNFSAFKIQTADSLLKQRIAQSMQQAGQPCLVLETCQRLECYGFSAPSEFQDLVVETWPQEEAFGRLVRIAAGLESRILGELEILGQVRNSYKIFNEKLGREQSFLDRIFQDAIALARKARRESGIDQNMTSLSGLAARELLDRCPAGAPLAVIGTGSLAGSVVRYLTKRGESPVRIMSRCPEHAISLAEKVGCFGAGLDALVENLAGVQGIVCATAAPHAVLYPRHLERVGTPLHIIDLGEPPDCSEDVQRMPGVSYTGLLEIESHSQLNGEERKACAMVAERIVKEGVAAWADKRQAAVR